MEAWTRALDVLKGLSLPVLLSLTATGLFILYGPPIDGLDIAAARKLPWIGPATILSAALAVARLLDLVWNWLARRRGERRRPVLVLTAPSAINTTWWGCSRQQDGSWATQVVVDINAFNTSEEYVQVVAVRLVKPRLAADRLLPPVYTVSHPGGKNDNSKDYPVRSRANGKMRVVLMAKGVLGDVGKFLWVTVGVTEQNGFEHRVRVRLWPTQAAGNTEIPKRPVLPRPLSFL